MSKRRECFLCGQVILPGEKSDKEHILSDSFLKEFNLKRERLAFGDNETEYSRLKVPAHQACNSGKGSQFENYVLLLLRSMASNVDVLRTLHRPDRDDVAGRVKEALSQWMAKLHLGFVYWEANYARHPDVARQQLVRQSLMTPVVGTLQRCFSQWHSFNVPSSLYYFSVPEPASSLLKFDFATIHSSFVTFIKFGQHLLISATADGFLTEDWFQDLQYKKCQAFLDEHKDDYPLSYLNVVAEIWSVRDSLPIPPRLDFEADKIVDRSRDGYIERPHIDVDAVNSRSAEILAELRERWIKK